MKQFKITLITNDGQTCSVVVKSNNEKELETLLAANNAEADSSNYLNVAFGYKEVGAEND